MGLRLRIHRRSSATQRFGKPVEVFMTVADVDRLREALRLGLSRQAAEHKLTSSLGEMHQPDQSGVVIDVASGIYEG